MNIRTCTLLITTECGRRVCITQGQRRKECRCYNRCAHFFRTSAL